MTFDKQNRQLEIKVDDKIQSNT